MRVRRDFCVSLFARRLRPCSSSRRSAELPQPRALAGCPALFMGSLSAAVRTAHSIYYFVSHPPSPCGAGSSFWRAAVSVCHLCFALRTLTRLGVIARARCLLCAVLQTCATGGAAFGRHGRELSPRSTTLQIGSAWSGSAL